MSTVQQIAQWFTAELRQAAHSVGSFGLPAG
jgi:hypothetical protein